MAAMSIYGKIFKKSSPEPSQPWGLIFAQFIGGGRSTKMAKIMVERWRLTFLRQDQICFLIHLYGLCTFIWEKY